MTDGIDIVFDGPPGATPGRFVEVENSNGRSIKVGEWLQRPDGYWVLRIFPQDLPATKAMIADAKKDEKMRQDAASQGVGYWAWQGDGEDHLESLTCPVLIRPEALLAIIQRAEKAEAVIENAEAWSNVPQSSEPPSQEWWRHVLGLWMARALKAEAIIAQHDLCHNLHGKVDARAFADGCAAEQRKHYGGAPDADLVDAVKKLVGDTDGAQ